MSDVLSVQVKLQDVYQAIHALHKSGQLEHCWYQACECEKIWKAVKEAANCKPTQ